MRRNQPSNFYRTALSLVAIVLFLGYGPLFKGLVFVSGSISVPVTIYLKGELETGSITDGIILITSGTVSLGDLSFMVSTTPLEGFNYSLNYVGIGSGKLNSTVLNLGNGYLMRLLATCTAEDTDTNIIHVAFYYGESFSNSTIIWNVYSYRYDMLRVPIFINATGTVTFSEGCVTIAAQGNALIWEEDSEVRNGCIAVIRKGFLVQGEPVVFQRWDLWRMSAWEDEDSYYVAVPEGSSVTMFTYLSPTSKLAGLLNSLGTAYSSERGAVIQITVSCDTGNTSMARLVVGSVRESLEDFMSKEREFLLKVGFDSEKYLTGLAYADMLLRESESAFERGDIEVGSGLLDKAVVKTNMALEALSQAKTDCIAMFLFSITFAFFLSSLVGMAFDNRRAFVSIGLFAMLVLAEIAFLPQVRMAVSLLNPEAMTRLTSTSLALSLAMALGTLLIVAMLIFEAKGTLLSDLFWYSVKSMRKRALRATLTIVTIAVVSAAAGSLIAVGSLMNTREATYPSEFHGLSVSSHVTTATYIFRGLDKQNDYIVNEFFEPIPESQVKWLSSMEGVEKTYVVSASQAFVSKEGRRARVSLVATNATMFNGTAVSASLAEALHIKEGDSIIIIGENVVESKVDMILEEPLRLVDGVPIEEVEEPLVVTGLEMFPQSSSIYRLVLEGNFSSDFAKRLVEVSYEKNTTFRVVGEAQITTQTFRSFQVCFGMGNGTKSLLIFGEFQQFSGTPEIIVLIGLSSLMIIITLLGSLYERQKEYSTITALGASPGRVSLLLFVEGLSYGLMGGVLGYVLSQFLQAYFSNPVTPVQPYVFSSMLASFLVALVSSIIGSLIPARRVVLKVVPSRFMFRKIEEIKLFTDHAEAMIPLRIIGDMDAFVTYVSSFTQRPSPMSWGPIYMQTSPLRDNDTVKAVEIVLSYRGERVAMFKVQLILPENPGSTIKAKAYSATGEWGIDHKYCAREMLTALREDLLQYVDWKKSRKEA
jgi:hypothetical protein